MFFSWKVKNVTLSKLKEYELSDNLLESEYTNENLKTVFLQNLNLGHTIRKQNLSK